MKNRLAPRWSESFEGQIVLANMIGPLWRLRAGAAAIHLILSAAVAALAAYLVFRLWYPPPYELLAGGEDLFSLIVSVDVVLGPLLTFAVYDPTKGRRKLLSDLVVIGVVQSAALAYGLSTCYQARPVVLAFEVDRYRVVTAAEVLERELSEARPPFDRLSMAGPKLVGVRRATEAERFEAIELAAQGFDTGQRPIFWVDFAQVRSQAWQRGVPLDVVLARCRSRRPEIVDVVRRAGTTMRDVRAVPLISRATDWSVLMDNTGTVIGFAPCDAFGLAHSAVSVLPPNR